MFSAATKTDNVSSAANYIEDVFSTYLYTGDGSGFSINNGIDLSGKGGMVWLKDRTSANIHELFDTARGATYFLRSNGTDAQSQNSNTLSAFNNNGFSIGDAAAINTSTNKYVSWTFRKQAKFFDVVTYTGNGAASRNINHSLGSTPGCIICKRTDSAEDWGVYHRSTGANGLYLNATNSAGVTLVPTGHTSTTFEVASGYGLNNVNGATYVAYLFAHDAGGFGATGSDNVISCGSFTDNGAIQSINLGYEPQWVLAKRTNITGDWWLVDNMRGMPVGSVDATLKPNAADAEQNVYEFINPEATGFRWQSGSISSSGQTWIYIAIRRGPMKTPTSGTSVFSPNAQTGVGTTAGQTLTTSFPVDLEISEGRATNGGAYFLDRLRGGQNYMVSASTAAEVNFTSYTPLISFANNTGILDANYGSTSNAYVAWNFRRAPSFFDVVCYTGTGSATTFNHNLTVVPELMIVKSRNNATNWAVYCAYLGGTNPANRYVLLNSSNSFGGTSVYWNDTAPTSTVFTVGTTAATNTSSYTYVNYLFATVAGVSKVGSYTGTGALQTINCGFASGARFVLIKRTDSTGDWWTYDSARGITSGNDPYLFLNSTAAEVTNTNYVDTASTGFQVTAAAPAGLNANGGTYIFLAIA